MLTTPSALILISLGISFNDNTVKLGYTISTYFLNGALIFGDTTITGIL